MNIGGFSYTAASVAGLFSLNTTSQERLAQSLKLASNTRGTWDFSLQVADFNYLKDDTRNSTGAYLAARDGNGTGRTNDAAGTGWATVDALGIWRPQGIDGNHFVSFGVHGDRYTLDNPTYTVNGNWRDGDKGALFSDSRGKTETGAVFVQELWRVLPNLSATVGVRYEWWRAFDGFNSTLVNGAQSPNPAQPGVTESGVSPKLALGWDITPNWLVTGSVGRALRFPTVGELYQNGTNIGTGNFVRPNPFLKPEDVLASEVSGEFHTAKSRLRVALFREDVRDALIGQLSTLPGTQTLASFTQNIDHTRQLGIEVAGDARDVLIKGLEVTGSVTYVDSEILRNDSYRPAAATPNTTSVGRRTPYIPLWRATLTTTYHATEALALSLAGRYSDRQYATIDNTDINPNTYQGFEGFFVADARANWKVTPQWTIAGGINNVLNRSYYLFHPFEQRTFFAELRWDY